MEKYYLILLFAFISLMAKSQITTEPAFPIANQKVKIIFDSKKESRLGTFSQDLYAHTGVGIEGTGNWQHVIGNWGQNDVQPKLTYVGDGVYELVISPDINTFYNVTSGEKVSNMSFVFRSASGNKQSNDLFITVYQTGLNLDIQFPPANAILEKDSVYTFSAVSSSTAALKMYLDDALVADTTGESIDASFNFDQPGEHKVLVTAENSEGLFVSDSTYICVRGDQVVEAMPAGSRKGITYLSNQSARLVLFAPGKSYVYLLGDFNNWQPKNSYLMKKDGDYFWMDVQGFEAGKEYIFQYFIDGKIKIADPYTEKISDPSNDSEITSDSYPDLISYPEGKTEEIASVLQTAQPAYKWEIPNFQVPETRQLTIYELLVRDFTTQHTYQSVIDKLNYLSDLRINVLELMPVSEFEGNNSWGYNPSFYFAPDKYYGPKNDLKKLIDECHKRGIAVVIDMVLNHSYGQSPLVRMYWDAANNRPASTNPWYNTVSPNTTYSWGYDFNHESAYTKELVDSINSFWINEYHVDGFRFDFTKGFTNKAGDGSAYDASRIVILERMADEIWKRKSDALVICEHLANNPEELELANHGLLLWGNINQNYGEAAMGYVQGSNSDLSWGVYKQRGWSKPNLVTYQESHDEERLTYKCLTWGNVLNDYKTTELRTALDRIKMNYLFQIPIPGPKMIWQFGEFGYDYSINTCDDGVTVSDGCRLSQKPVRWDYRYNSERSALFQVVGSLNYLKQNYEEFSMPTNFSYALSGAQKSINLTFGTYHVVIIGNFALEEKTMSVKFPVTGTWNDYFNNSTIQVGSSTMDLTLKPGEYHLFSTRKFSHPEFTTTDVTAYPSVSGLNVFPNPVDKQLIIENNGLAKIQIFNLNGQKLREISVDSDQIKPSVDVNFLAPGMYILKAITSGNELKSCKFIKN
ncbi:MAG TPA: alpha-amylase family glycosyl hydrolase [Prolixibacteraceae bacterium]|mgnify:CR=1 FL=1|nr:alpha-amylase family glycosyl hydrolase [Prolixibacteraceae bacterium]HPS12942.1 alpha-amylase family glycosyl hydrolase [Prolixibacteraceae bacterium]